MNESAQVYSYTKSKINSLQGGDPWSKAMLAKLRRGAGKDIRDSHESWEIVIGGLPDNLVGNDTRYGFVPSPAESAIHSALTLYAVHMQGQSTSVSQEDVTFARAAGKLMSLSDSGGIKRRFDAISTASNIDELTYHARGLIQLMRQHNLHFNYPGLASDLYRYQLPNGPREVLLKWGQDFYAYSNENKEESE